MADSEPNDQFSRLNRLTEISRALSGERDLTKLLELIMRSAMQVTNADGGTLYRTGEDGQSLSFDLVFNATLNLHFGGTSGKQANFPPMRLFNADGKPNDTSVVAHAALTRKSVRIDDAYTVKGFDFVGARKFDEAILHLDVFDEDQHPFLTGMDAIDYLEAGCQPPGETDEFLGILDGRYGRVN